MTSRQPPTANRQPTIARILLLVLVASTIFYGGRRLLDTLLLARHMAPFPLEQRRLLVFGEWYGDVRAILDATPANASIDLVMVTPSARDIAVLGGAALYPRDCRFFEGWEDWKARKRAEFLRDRRAANAAPGGRPGGADFVVAVDPEADPRFRIVR